MMFACFMSYDWTWILLEMTLYVIDIRCMILLPLPTVRCTYCTHISYALCDLAQAE